MVKTNGKEYITGNLADTIAEKLDTVEKSFKFFEEDDPDSGEIDLVGNSLSIYGYQVSF